MSHWTEEEVQTANLEDQRLNKRFAKVLAALGSHPQLSIPAACGGWNETIGAYRFFDNQKATFEKILTPHREATLERMKACPVVLLAQDTTEDDEIICLGPKGLDTLKAPEKRERRLHPTVAFTPSRICLGVVKAAYWTREPPQPACAAALQRSGRERKPSLAGKLPGQLRVTGATPEHLVGESGRSRGGYLRMVCRV